MPYLRCNDSMPSIQLCSSLARCGLSWHSSLTDTGRPANCPSCQCASNSLIPAATDSISQFPVEAFPQRGLGREPGETPIEFCQRLTEDIPAFEQNARRLGENYSRVSYARATLGRPSLDALQALWQRLTLPVREEMVSS